MNNLNKYNLKRNFSKTKEPEGKIKIASKELKFVIQHHLASRDHYDFRLEWKGTLKSWAVPKGPSFNPADKRLAVMVEDHPYSYRDFEGTIPKGQYGGGTVMLWDEGTWQPANDISKGLKEGSIKFILNGKRLKGKWALAKMKDDNWLLIKEKDKYSKTTPGITRFTKSIRTDRTMKEIADGLKKRKTQKLNKTDNEKCIIECVTITSPDKVLFDKSKITKKDVALYYEKIASRMLPFLKDRLISSIRCPDGIKGTCFFKKHLETKNKGVGKITIPSDNEKEDYYYIKTIEGLISEVQMNTIEFHTWGSKVKKLDKPDIMVFDLDPDDKLELKKLKDGVKDLKSILDKLSLVSFLKTSGGKGYHVVVPLKPNTSWEDFRNFSKNIAKVMEEKWPNKYTSNVRKVNRKNRIFVDWIRNTEGATSIAPYSLRARKGAKVSMPILWSELEKVAPDDITMEEAIKRLKRKNPWEDFFDIKQSLK